MSGPSRRKQADSGLAFGLISRLQEGRDERDPQTRGDPGRRRRRLLAGSPARTRIARSRALRGLRSDLIDPAIAAHHGRIVKRTGDGSIIEFRSVVDAVRCAIEVQNGMVERNAGRVARASASSFASASISATSSRRATAT